MTRPLPAQSINNTFTPDNLLNSAETASNLVSQYIVSPLLNLGFAGLVFDVEDETSIELNSNITTHYTEDNSYMQDHIALEPDRITLRRYVGELVFRAEPESNRFQQLTQKIATIAAFVPIVTEATRQVQDAIRVANDSSSQLTDYLQSSIGAGVNLYQTFKALNPPKTKQAQAFNFLRALWSSRQLVSLETPYTFYGSMAIESIKVTQPSESKDISEFSITLVKIRTARTKFAAFDPKKYQGRTLGQASELQEKGRANGTTLAPSSKDSILRQIYDKFF